MTIGFDRPMNPVDDTNMITQTKVAIQYDVLNQDNKGRRILAAQESDGVWFEDLERNKQVHMMLLDAIEVKF